MSNNKGYTRRNNGNNIKYKTKTHTKTQTKTQNNTINNKKNMKGVRLSNNMENKVNAK